MGEFFFGFSFSSSTLKITSADELESHHHHHRLRRRLSCCLCEEGCWVCLVERRCKNETENAQIMKENQATDELVSFSPIFLRDTSARTTTSWLLVIFLFSFPFGTLTSLQQLRNVFQDVNKIADEGEGKERRRGRGRGRRRRRRRQQQADQTNRSESIWR